MVNRKMFQNEILTQSPNTMKMAENDMKKHLIEDFDKLLTVVTKSNRKVVTSVEFVKRMCY